MSSNRRTYRRNSPEAAARVIAALIAHDGRRDWREFAFLDGAGTLRILGIERGRFCRAAWASSRAASRPAVNDAIRNEETASRTRRP